MTKRDYEYQSYKLEPRGRKYQLRVTQKYKEVEGGDKYFLPSYDYVLFEGLHIVNKGGVSGSHIEELTDKDIQELFDRLMSEIKL